MNLSNSISFADECDKVTRYAKFDLCQAHDTYSILAADRIRRRDDALMVYDALEIDDDRSGHTHGTDRHLGIRLEKYYNIKAIKAADEVFGVGPSLAKWTQQRYGLEKPVKVVRNCTLYHPDYQSSQMKSDLELGPEVRLALVIGSIYHDQGFEQLIEALPELPKHIHVAGLGPALSEQYIFELKDLAFAFEVADRFHIMPPQPPHNLIRYASGADIGIISRQNTCLNNQLCMPNKVFEMIMSRLPIAASRLPDIVALVKKHGIGMIFDETDIKDMARVINVMLQEEKLKAMREAIDKLARDLCWEKESIKYVDAIESLAEESGDSPSEIDHSDTA